MSNPRYGSGRKQFVGQGVEADLSKLDPAAYPGAVAYSDGELYYSDGSEWVVPQDEVDIARPRNLAPTTAIEQAQLRLTAFRSPTGETQTGIIFEINTAGLPDFGQGASLITRTVTSQVASLYNVLYPDDGFEPGETIWWRARYLGTNSSQSQFSIPTAQNFPDLITTPTPVTLSNAITGSVTLSPYESAPVFGLQYFQTQVEFYAVGAVPGVDTPLSTVTQTGGAVTTAPIPPLVAGQSYQWRGRYTGRVNSGSPTITSNWSAIRTIFLGGASIVLEYDLTLMVARTINVPINTLNNALKPLNVTVNWGDNTSNTYTTAGTKTKTYAVGFTPANNRVQVVISGVMDWYGTSVAIDQSGLVRVENIGFQMGLESLRGAFRGTKSHLEYITPNLPTSVTSLQEAFRDSFCAANLSTMDTRYITNMQQLFLQSKGVGPNCSGWDVRSVTNVFQAFGSSQMNSPFSLGNWLALTSMEQMFVQTASNYITTGNEVLFNQPIAYWDVSRITNMKSMFGSVASIHQGRIGGDFNQPIGTWDVSKVTNFSYMFGCDTNPGIGGAFVVDCAFNQPINTWNVSSATNMAGMFSYATNFNQDLSSWDVSKVTNMSIMFGQIPGSDVRLRNSFNHPGIAQWNMSAVTNTSYMFRNASFNQPLANWERTGSTLANVTNMSYMFDTSIFDQPIGNWNVSNVTNMSFMFANSFTNFTYTVFNQNIGAWNVGNVTNMSSMFAAAGGGTSQIVRFNNGGSPSINNWNTSKVTNMSYMFGNPASSTHSSLFNQPIGNWDVSKVTDMSYMLQARNGVFNQDLSGWNLNPAGVNLTNFLAAGSSAHSMSQENYSRLLTSWANKVADVYDGPFLLTMGAACNYNTTAYQPASRFTNATAARAYLVAARSVTVAGSSNTDGNGVHTLNVATGAYVNSNSWYFLKSGSVWTLYNASNVSQATGTGVFPWDVTTWTGVLSAATVLSSGAAWTITGDAAV